MPRRSGLLAVLALVGAPCAAGIVHELEVGRADLAGIVFVVALVELVLTAAGFNAIFDR